MQVRLSNVFLGREVYWLSRTFLHGSMSGIMTIDQSVQPPSV